MVRTTIGLTDWGDDLNVDLSDIEQQARGKGFGHGDVAGPVSVNIVNGNIQEMNLVGNITVTVSGAIGNAISIRATGVGTLSLANADWDSTPGVVPGIFTVVRWPSGWRVHPGATGLPVEVVTVAPTFTAVGNVLTIPTVIGVQYLRNGVLIAPGTYPSQAAGLMTITAAAKSGYFLSTGSVVSWTYTFQVVVTPSGVPNLAHLWDASVAGSFTFSTGTNVSAWNDTVGTAHLLQSVAAQQPNRSETINGLSAVKFQVVTSDVLQAANAVVDKVPPHTVMAIFRIDSLSPTGAVIGTLNHRIDINDTGFISGTSTGVITHTTVKAAGNLVFVMFRVDTTSKLDVDGVVVSSAIATSNYTWKPTFGARTGINNFSNSTICECAVWLGSVTDTEVAGLRNYAQQKWGTP